jgi:2,6-dihydroxypseudooxynicotine hydrolase
MIDDSGIQEALNHWTPRFLASGIDYNDLQRILARMKSWPDWCRTWSEMGAQHRALADEAMSAGHTSTACDAYRRASMYYHFGNAIFYTDPVQKQAAHREKVACYAQAAPLLHPRAERIDISYENITLPAFLRLPDGPGPHPCVVLVCGLDSVKEQEYHWEQVLLERGMATLSFDGPGQGETWYRMKMRADFESAVSAVVDDLARRREIDRTRIGLLGHSMGGHFGARAAARDHRIAAAALIAGFFELPPWEEMSVFLRAGLQFIFGASDQAQAQACAKQLTLEGLAREIRCPLFLAHGAKDTLIPVEEAYRIQAAVTCPTELFILTEGNHSCNNLVYRIEPGIADWLADRLAHSQ